MRISVFATWHMWAASRVRLLLFVCLCVLHVTPSSWIAAQSVAPGYVADISGSWLVANRKADALRIGSVLSVRDSIVPGARGNVPQRIQILLPSRASIASDCSDTAGFGTRTARCHTLLIPEGPKAESWWQRALATAMNQLRTHEAERYESLISRGGAPMLADGVVRGQGERVDIAPILAGAPAGRYRLCFVPVASEDTLASSSDGSCRASAAYDWTSQGASTVKLPERLRGLFELRVARASQRSFVWVLIEDEDQYLAVQRTYTRFSAAATSARPALSPEAVQRLRRAYLAALSSSGAKPNSATRSR